MNAFLVQLGTSVDEIVAVLLPFMMIPIGMFFAADLTKRLTGKL